MILTSPEAVVVASEEEVAAAQADRAPAALAPVGRARTALWAQTQVALAGTALEWWALTQVALARTAHLRLARRPAAGSGPVLPMTASATSGMNRCSRPA